LSVSELAPRQAFSQRFEGDVLKSIALKKFGRLCVYFS
jgi:hypothetical protein